MTQLLRVQNFSVSSDGYGSGEGQSREHPFGHISPMVLHQWAFDTTRRGPDGTRGLDDYFTRDFDNNIGAEIMGRNKFGPQRGPWEDHEWQGWWGEDPPFHTPVFVLTHHPRPSFTLTDNTFHFIDATPAEALEQAKAAADGKDVRLGGGVQVVRDFLAADLVDALHIAVVPTAIGRGEKLWDSPDELVDRYHRESVLSPSGVTHHIYWRR